MRAGALALTALSASGCATVTRGTDTIWRVATTPADAAVATSNGLRCAATPCAFRVARTAEFEATVTKPGFRPVTFKVRPVISDAGSLGMAGDGVLAVAWGVGLVGAGVDTVTGATHNLAPNPAEVALEAAPGAAPAPSYRP